MAADDLSEIALELENIGRSGSLEHGTEALERLEEAFYRLEVYADSKWG